MPTIDVQSPTEEKIIVVMGPFFARKKKRHNGVYSCAGEQTYGEHGNHRKSSRQKFFEKNNYQRGHIVVTRARSARHQNEDKMYVLEESLQNNCSQSI